MDLTHIALLAAGLALLALAVLTRSRASAGRWGGTDGQERFVIVGLPLLGTVLLLVGLLPVLPEAAETPVAGVVMLLCLIAIAWGPLGFPLPRWVVPGHLRAARNARQSTDAARRRARKQARRG